MPNTGKAKTQKPRVESEPSGALPFDELHRLMRMVSEMGLSEIHVESAGVKIRIVGGGGTRATDGGVPSSVAVADVAALEPAVDEGLHLVTSPMVGTFYRRPRPGAPAFVDVGSEVKAGQVMCIVEAMKLMNEIEADLGGVVQKVLAEDGQPVEFGQPLFGLRVS